VGEGKTLLVLLDGHGIIHRSYHAMREQPLTVRHTGEVITAVYGFANTLLSVLQELRPSHVIVAMDKGRLTFRHRLDPNYKAHRVEMPDDLRAQIHRCRELIEAFGIPIYEREGYEADDILGTLSRQAAEAGIETCLVSLDSDIAQLVRPGVRLWLYRPYQRDFVVYASPEEVQRRYGVLPHQIPDLKALKGDATDNISGVPGVGEKTAVRLVQEFGSIEALYEDLERVEPPKLREALRQHEEQVRRSKELATIATDVPVELDLDAADFRRHYRRQRVLDLFRELEFKSLVPRLPSEDGQAEEERPLQMPLAGRPAVAEAGAERYGIVDTEEALSELARRLEAAGAFAFDTETTGLEAMRARLVGLSFAVAPGEAYYVPVGHAGAGRQLPLELVLERLGPLLASEGLEKTAHNAKYDMVVLAQHGVWVRGLQFDTMIAAFLAGEGGGGTYRPGEGALGLKWLASRLLGVEMTDISQLIGRRGREQISMAEVPVEAAGRYACADADMTLRLRPRLEEMLRERAQERLFYDIEMPVVPVLARMELNGMAVDVAVLQEMSGVLAEEVRRVEEEVYRAVGHRFNIGSPQQLSRVLFEELRLPKTRRLKTGSYSTDAQSLEELRGAHPIIDLIFEYRELTKLKGTYVDALPGLVNPRTGRIHSDFNQTGAATGRISSSNPNLQNIPVRTELGRQIRRAFVARDVGPDPYLLSADYSQIELRILAHYTGDPALVEAFRRDEDIHAVTAAQVFGVAREQVTPEMRRRAKVFNFGVLYGLTPYGLSVRERIPQEEAAEFIRRYFERYPGVRRYIEETVQRARELGYAETIFGRRRYLPDINSANVNVRQAAERAAINMPIQGTNADIMKLAMARVHQELERRRLRSLMVLQVHDELIFECPAAELAEMQALVLEIMPRAAQLAVPLKVDVKVGRTWGDME
jgi:DNA polymerase-1